LWLYKIYKRDSGTVIDATVIKSTEDTIAVV